MSSLNLVRGPACSDRCLVLFPVSSFNFWAAAISLHDLSSAVFTAIYSFDTAMSNLLTAWLNKLHTDLICRRRSNSVTKEMGLGFSFVLQLFLSTLGLLTRKSVLSCPFFLHQPNGLCFLEVFRRKIPTHSSSACATCHAHLSISCLITFIVFGE